MPAPATTGQLRTKVVDMEIGDYIESKYYFANNIRIFGGLGHTPSNEIPYTGLARTSGYQSFYYIKVAKGLLVSDRIVQHSVTWDALNTAKLIQGLPWDTRNIIPTMTSNTSPSGRAMASSIWDNTFDAWKAFNGTTKDYTDTWVSKSGDGIAWLGYEFPNSQIITSYAITSRNNTGANVGRRDPSDWTFEASDDGQEWITLHEVKGERIFSINEKRLYSFSNKKAYKMYRVHVTATKGTNAENTYVSIGLLEMFETAGVIRSLTGGVAYADANGNKSLTNQGYGAWPVNNEWDKYIVNFPQEKIQEGKTLDDVFHWSVSSTWSQETPINGSTRIGSNLVGTNYRRVYRSYRAINGTDEKLWVFNDSSLSDATVGFRPVFEYKE